MATNGLRHRVLSHVQLHEARKHLQAALENLNGEAVSRAKVKDHVARAELLINDQMPEATGAAIDDAPHVIERALLGLAMLRAGARAENHDVFGEGLLHVDQSLNFLLAIILLRTK